MFFYRVLDVNIGVSFFIHHNQVNNGLAVQGPHQRPWPICFTHLWARSWSILLCWSSASHTLL